MSRANVIILSPDRKVLAYSLYDGTTDWQTPRLWATQDEAWEQHDHENRMNDCPHEGEPNERFVFTGFSIGYGGEGPRGLIEFADIFGILIDKAMVLGNTGTPEAGTLKIMASSKAQRLASRYLAKDRR